MIQIQHYSFMTNQLQPLSCTIMSTITDCHLLEITT